jgi:hypothetical protein
LGKPLISDYGYFLTAFNKKFARMVEGEMITAEEVARVIYGAVTDGTDTLRYVIGSEGFNKRVAALLTMPDQEYVQSVKSGYLQYLPQD